MGELYKLTFENGKQYIGIAKNGAQSRFAVHEANRRRIHSLESRTKLRAANLGLTASQATRAKMSISSRNQSPEMRAKQAASLRQYWANRKAMNNPPNMANINEGYKRYRANITEQRQ